MRTREDAIAYCLTLPGAYEDYPFDDTNWTLMRLHGSRRSFACIFEREGHIWINVKCDPEWAAFWRNTYPSVLPAYHMNKRHWNSLILDGSIPDREIETMIFDSYELVRGRRLPPKEDL